MNDRPDLDGLEPVWFVCPGCGLELDRGIDAHLRRAHDSSAREMFERIERQVAEAEMFERLLIGFREMFG